MSRSRILCDLGHGPPAGSQPDSIGEELAPHVRPQILDSGDVDSNAEKLLGVAGERDRRTPESDRGAAEPVAAHRGQPRDSDAGRALAWEDLITLGSHPDARALYHRRPEGLVGVTLWPLSSLATISQAAYERARHRYDDRPGLLSRPVEPLDCTWSDVVFLSPVHPTELQRAARRGRPSWPELDWLIIDTDALELSRAVLYTPRRWPAGEDPPPITAADCERCTPESLSAAREPTAETLTRLRRPTGRLALFVDVVHVLHRGPIDIDITRTIHT